ncbi:cupin domain-containing protein [Paradonghicola geojensis]|nr:cupin domain-containing protein [Marivivens geojensis]
MHLHHSTLVLAFAAVTVFASHVQAETYPPLDVLLQTETTIIGQQLIYPDGTAQITVAIVSMEPGEVTGWHRHEAPLIAHILSGELTVDYGTDGTRVYREGDTLVEALGSRHNGTNTGEAITRIFVVFAGAADVPNTVSE